MNNTISKPLAKKVCLESSTEFLHFAVQYGTVTNSIYY